MFSSPGPALQKVSPQPQLQSVHLAVISFVIVTTEMQDPMDQELTQLTIKGMSALDRLS
jgi:hypothetical protein